MAEMQVTKELALVPDPTVLVYGLLVGDIVPSAWKTWEALAWLAVWAVWWRCSRMAQVSCSCSDPQTAPLVFVWTTAMAEETQVCHRDPQQST